MQCKQPAYNIIITTKLGKINVVMASLYKHMGKLQSAVTLILRRESKFYAIKFVFQPILRARLNSSFSFSTLCVTTH